MAQDALFLLASPFPNLEAGPGKYYCPECATLEGLLSYHPELTQHLNIRRVAFARPRSEIIDLLGAELQSAPVLVIGDLSRAEHPEVRYSPLTKRPYVSGLRPIAAYLAASYGISSLHP